MIWMYFLSYKACYKVLTVHRGMDTENVVHLHNEVLLSYYKKWNHKILRQMDGSGGYHLKWGNPATKENTWYAFTDKCILAQKLRIPKVQFRDHMKLKQNEYQNVDTSVLLRRVSKILI